MSHKLIGESGTPFCSRMLVVPACASTFHREPVKLPNAVRVVSNVKDLPSFDARSNRRIRLNSLAHNQCDPEFLWTLEHESLSPLSNMLIYVWLEQPWDSHMNFQDRVATSSIYTVFPSVESSFSLHTSYCASTQLSLSSWTRQRTPLVAKSSHRMPLGGCFFSPFGFLSHHGFQLSIAGMAASS